MVAVIWLRCCAARVERWAACRSVGVTLLLIVCMCVKLSRCVTTLVCHTRPTEYVYIQGCHTKLCRAVTHTRVLACCFLRAALAQRLLGEGVAGPAKVGAIAAAAVDPQEHGVAAAVGAHARALDLLPALGALAAAGAGLQARRAGQTGGWSRRRGDRGPPEVGVVVCVRADQRARAVGMATQKPPRPSGSCMLGASPAAGRDSLGTTRSPPARLRTVPNHWRSQLVPVSNCRAQPAQSRWRRVTDGGAGSRPAEVPWPGRAAVGGCD